MNLEPAGLIRRFIAWLVDGFMFFILLIPFFILAAIFFLHYIDSNAHNDLIVSSSSLFIEAIGAILMALMSIYVVRLNQVKIGFGFALVRFLSCSALPCLIEKILILILVNFFNEPILEFISFVFYVLWFIAVPIISSKNQTIHDILCKTVVVKGRLEKN